MSKQKRPGPRDEARHESKSTFDDVVALIKERRKYVDWIAALEAKREQTPAHVYERVHADYETRLDAVSSRLATHRDSLTEQQNDLKAKLAEVDEEMQLHQESRSETELRAHVGELTAAALTEALRIVDTELERLMLRRDSLDSDLARIAEFFAAVDGTPLQSTTGRRRNQTGFDELSFLHSVVGAPKPEAKHEVKAEPAKVEAVAPEPPKHEPVKAEAPPPKPEPVKAEGPPPKPVEVPVTPPEVPAPRPTPPPMPTPRPTPPPMPTPAPEPPRVSMEKKPEPAAVQADGVIEKEEDLAPKPPPVSRPSIAMQMSSMTFEPGEAAVPSTRESMGIIKTGDALPPSILSDLKPAEDGSKPFAANVASNNPLSLKSSGAPSDLKTLKCRECGAMNDPSEWYCERCGAELSAI